MAKVSGIVSSVIVDDASGTPRTISGDVTSVQLGTPTNLQDVTGLDKSAIERLSLLRDFTANLTGVANFASNQEHDVFKASPTGTRTVALGLANAAATLTFEARLGDYTFSRGQDGSLTYTASLMNADGNVGVWS